MNEVAFTSLFSSLELLVRVHSDCHDHSFAFQCSWWASRAPAGAAERYLQRRTDGSDKLPKWMAWWEPVRERKEGLGWGRDVRGAGGAYAQVSMWDGEVGGLGMAPPGLKTVLRDLGVAVTSAARVASEVEGILAKAMSEIWRMRCQRQMKAEREKGITDDQKWDNQRRGGGGQHRRKAAGGGPAHQGIAEKGVTTREAWAMRTASGWNTRTSVRWRRAVVGRDTERLERKGSARSRTAEMSCLQGSENR